MVRGPILDPPQGLHRFGMERAGGHPVDGFGRNHDQPALHQRLHGAVDHIAVFLKMTRVKQSWSHG